MSITTVRNGQIRAQAIKDAEVANNAAIATSKLADGAEFLKRNGSVALTGNLNGNDLYTISNLPAPVNPNDAARKVDVQNASLGLNVKSAVRAATTAADADLTLTGAATIDTSVVLVSGDRVLVKNQVTAPETNGIYIVSTTGAWTRATDFDSSAEIKLNSFMFVSEGPQNADSGWVLTNDGAIVLDTTPLAFSQFSGGNVTTTAANVGVGGIGIFKAHVGNTLQLRNIHNTDGKIAVTLDSTNNLVNVNIAATSLVDGDISATAAITRSKLASGNAYRLVINDSTGVMGDASAITASRALASDANGIPVASATTATELGYVAGLTSAVQTQIDAKLSKANYIVRENPTGTINGVNAAFDLSATTILAGSEMVFLNGLLQEPSGEDYTISGITITFAAAPIIGDRIRVTYVKTS